MQNSRIQKGVLLDIVVVMVELVRCVMVWSTVNQGGRPNIPWAYAGPYAVLSSLVAQDGVLAWHQTSFEVQHVHNVLVGLVHGRTFQLTLKDIHWPLVRDHMPGAIQVFQTNRLLHQIFGMEIERFGQRTIELVLSCRRFMPSSISTGWLPFSGMRDCVPTGFNSL